MRAGRAEKRTRRETALADIEHTIETFVGEIRREIALLQAELFADERAPTLRPADQDS